MDASASTRSDVDVVGLFLKIEKSDFPSTIKQRNTVYKYTRLPEFDIDSTVSWSRESYMLPPRLRRIITLEAPRDTTTRSLKHDVLMPPKTMCSNVSKRKIVTITEDDEYDLHPRFSKDRKSSSVKTSNRSVEANFKDKQVSQRTTSRIVNTVKLDSKDTRSSAKSQNPSEGSPVIPKSNYGNKSSKTLIENLKSRNIKEKESFRSHKSANTSKTSVSKNYVSASESDRELKTIKSKLYDNNKTPKTKYTERSRFSNSPTGQKNRASVLKEIHTPLTVIRVPLDDKYLRPKIKSNLLNTNSISIEGEIPKSDNATATEKVLFQDISVSTEPQCEKVDQETDMHNLENQIYYSCMKSTDVQTEVVKEPFDSLHIPDVTLTTDKTESKVEYLDLQSKSLPNLRTPSFKITPNKHERNSVDTNFCNNKSYIISRATLTYTTKQKINFEVVGSNDNTYSNHTPSPLAYPMSVVSVFKNEMKQCENNTKGHKRKDNTGIQKETTNYINEIKSLDCSYVSNSNKLMKPSDIISTIRVNNGLSQSDFICEQFQRELNFIESFFESLQYLENCSLSDTCFNDGKIDSLVQNSSLLDTNFDVKISDYDNLISRLEDGETASDSETMASKNLFMLNILIQDEQRRAKNLLFVLKRREDALKDFTKSQILYLENKKKNYSQDFSALQKKQRGALLKLQHECGEMQRMRKALLTLSERRKVALMRTKKDLELKLRNNVDVERIILSKKKLKRNAGVDRSAPLKCFDLSSSGCEESSGSRQVSESEPRASAEKSIQTGESVLVPADEHAVAVDGTYLNILFQNLSLPQIFSGGKQYEVNEEALRNIVNSTTQRERDVNDTDVNRLMEQLTSREEQSSSPSTARSLLDELEQYYHGLNEERAAVSVCELTDDAVQATSELEKSPSPVVLAPAGPLPVPAGAARVDPPVIDVTAANVVSSSTSATLNDSTSVSTSSLCGMMPSISTLSAPAQCEAEELRRQQLAIEKEIKELEQQQCRLVVVREIPDKPPPPYTPPVEHRPTVHPRLFALDAETTARVADLIARPEPIYTHDAFDAFLQDFCVEAVERHRNELSDAPWDACNLMSASSTVHPNNRISQTTTELAEVLTGAAPTVLSGVSSRRSDHIDDILFAEWRRIEPAWTSLHSDEATVKNQIFESIFQRVLTETIDEYKRTLRCHRLND